MVKTDVAFFAGEVWNLATGARDAGTISQFRDFHGIL